MFLSESHNLDMPEIIEIENKNGIINVGDDNEIMTRQREIPDTVLIHSSDITNKQNIVVFEIPLLTREQALQFDPTKEILTPKAYSGEYPDYTLVPIPFRLKEYSTDLRAIVVFNSMMTPVLNPGEVTIFQVTGWNGNGIYIYQMSGDLHISHVHSDGKNYQFSREFESEERIPYDMKNFKVIGRVRAVVREIA
jgi:hypothetical protein